MSRFLEERFTERDDPYFDELGREIPDQTPIEIPVELAAQPGFLDMIHQQVQAELRRQMLNDSEEFETDEEADDFDVGDDFDPDVPFSPYEADRLDSAFEAAAPADGGSPPVEEAAPPAPAADPAPEVTT